MSFQLVPFLFLVLFLGFLFIVQGELCWGSYPTLAWNMDWRDIALLPTFIQVSELP